MTASSSWKTKKPSPARAEYLQKQPETSGASAKGVRLNKALADAGVCSRRKADELIAQGRVSVNGYKAADMGTRVNPAKDRITVDGKNITGADERVCLLMHKPAQIMCTVSDPEKRTTVIDILPEQWRKFRLYPVGRLDFFSEGLIFLTNDGELAQRLAHPRHHLPKIYRVRLREEADDAQLEIMRRGMTLKEGEKLAPVEIRRIPWKGEGCVLEMTLHQGLNRQIRRMCRDLNLTILRLARIAQGPVSLGDLPKGAVRELSGEELRALRQAVALL